MKKNTTIGTTEAAERLTEAGVPVTASSIRRWAANGFAIRIAGRWRIPTQNIVELENKLAAAANDDQVLPCASAS